MSDVFNNSNSSSESEADEEIAVTDKIHLEFKQKYKVLHESSISLNKVYILNITTDRCFTKLVAGTSNGTVQIFDINSNNLNKSELINLENNGPVCGVKFIDETANSLLIGNVNGEINLFDLRSNEKCHTFEDKTTGDTRKTITCFDVNSNNRVLCAGTEQIFHDVFLIFYDIRDRKLIDGYWESHQDDITDVKFHPTKQDLLISGSTDGLINIYDVSQENEEDALQETINTENSVQKLNWHKNVYEKDLISCITHTNDLKIFDMDEGNLITSFDRNAITNKISKSNDLNLINCHNTEEDSIFVLGGSNLNKGETLRSLKIHNKSLIPFGTFQGNKQIIRDSIFNVEKNILVTSGETGIITLWCPSDDFDKNEPSKLKIKSIEKVHKKKPY